jgi:hypothetical protein
MLTNQLHGLDLAFPAALMATFAALTVADIVIAGRTIDARREDWGVGGDHMIAGFLRLSIAAGEYLDERIECYHDGVFSYDFLEAHRSVPTDLRPTLPVFLLAHISDDQFYQLMGNWTIPENLHDIIEQWFITLPSSVVLKA